MRLLFASTVPHLPHNTGGMQTSTDALARAFRDRGHTVAAFGALPLDPTRERPARKDPAAKRDPRSSPRIRLDAWAVDESQSYPTYRAMHPVAAFENVLADWRPDIVVVPFGAGTAPLAALTLHTRRKVVLYAHSAEPRDIVTPIARPDVLLIANSAFTARRLHTLLGVLPPVVPPLIDPALYRVAHPGENVVLINPTQLKGAEIFFRLAEARPSIPFLAVESWNISDDWRTVLVNRARALGNVALWQASEDMREVFAQARLILMPSIHEETFGRAIAEAQVSGIPALISDRGALPETLGEGGIVVPLDAGPDAWAAALDRIWSDPSCYRRASAAALRQASRTERNPGRVIEAFLDLLQGLHAAATSLANHTGL
jgi:glycosyltransferase involved in cell wall biosynthesis